MTEHCYIEPEVAGGLGKRTVIDTSVHPPVVSKLHYEMDGWLGDSILESFPSFIVTEALKEALEQLGASGMSFDEAEVTTSGQFRALHPRQTLPKFVWLKVQGTAGVDDLALADDGRLVVSARALEVMQKHGADNAVVEAFGG
ncbi:MAG: hypothetical protein R3C27_15000 [Hyphomonadaceae bacterium]